MSRLGGDLLAQARRIQRRLPAGAYWTGKCRGIGRNVWFEFACPTWEEPKLMRL